MHREWSIVTISYRRMSLQWCRLESCFLKSDTHVSNAETLRQTSKPLTSNSLWQKPLRKPTPTIRSAMLETRLVLLLSFVSLKVCKPPDLSDNLLHSCNCKNNNKKLQHYVLLQGVQPIAIFRHDVGRGMQISCGIPPIPQQIFNLHKYVWLLKRADRSKFIQDWLCLCHVVHVNANRRLC